MRFSSDKMKFLGELIRHFLTAVDAVSKDTSSSSNSGSGSSNGSTLPANGNGHSVSSGEASGAEAKRYTALELGKTLKVLSRSFLDHLQEQCKQRLVAALDADRWVQTDAGADRQAQLDRLVSGRLYLSVSSTTPMRAQDADRAHTGTSASRKDSRPVSVNGVQYHVVWSCLLLCEQLVAYLDIASTLVCISPEEAAQETVPKIVELLKLFDTRSRLLVLGAGAIQSAARLKSISAKHLAYTAQSLGFLRALIPHIRAALLAVLPPSQHILLSELERVAGDLIDHHSSIVAKLVTIAGDSIDASVTKLRSVDWERFQLPCEYFEDVARNISALHRVLYDCIPAELLQDIFSRIFALISRKLPTHFTDECHIDPTNPTSRQRIVEAVVLLTTALGRLKGLDPGANLVNLEATFRKKYSVPEPEK